MTQGEIDDGAVRLPTDDSAPTQVVERFLELLGAGDVDGAVELLSADVEYVNVGLPTVHGRERVRRLFQASLGQVKILTATMRGLLGTVIPAARARPPSTA